MAGNMQPVRVSAAGLFTFRLKKGSTVLLEEDYVPDASGQAEIDIRDLVLSDLSLSLPSADVFKQTAAAASYTISTDTDSRTFKAVLGSIDRPATDAATFLGANFLTWQPQLKSVTYGQPEWLSFYTPATAVSLKAKFYLKDGTTSTVTVAASFDPGCVYSVNVRFSRLWSLGEGDRYGMVDVWLEDDQSTALTYVQRYVLDTSGDERTVLVARNSLGGIDTFSFLGSMERSAEAEHTNVMRGETMCSGLVDMTRTYTVNTGILSGHGRDWVWDLQRSPQAWVLMDGALRGIVMLAPAVTASMYEDSTGTVDFLICDDSGYLNMPRLESLPENIEVPGPDGEVFFLAPRLADYPDASLDGPLLLPVQSPAAQEWSKMSVAALSSYILSAVDDKYGEFLHVHDNLPVLSKLSVDDSGRLMYDGEPVGGSGLTEHDHHGDTIRPEKIVVGTVEITCVDGRLHVSSTITSDGDFVAYGDDEGGEAGGGLDVARLWEELKAEDASKVIDVSHIPGSVVLQDELTEILDDYPLTTEVNTALGGKADKGWVEEELAKYLLLTGGKISGDLEVAGTLKIGDAVLSYADGRLHVSSSVTSDGDFVAFGDEEGSTGSGGLDVDRMWDELEAEGTEQIHASHLSDALTGYATQTYVDGRINDLINGAPAAYDTLKEIAAALEDNEDSIGAILTTLGGKADKATTLAGYGITDAYTKTQIDEELAKYVTIAGNQDITGVKTFVNGIKIGSISLSVVDGRLHVSSTVTSDGDFVAFGDEEGSTGSGGLDVDRMWDELEAADSSKVIDVSHVPSITVSKISDFPDKWPWADISGKPSTFAPSAHSHAISEVTGLQGALNSKWVWSESQVKAVKVNSAASADNADTLDGVHANGLLTALASSATTNLSLTVGGKSLSVAGLYAKFADQLRTAQKINGTSFNGAYDITTEKWGMARLVSIKDYTQDNAGATKSVDGQESFSLLLPQSIKVKTLDVDGVTLSVIDGRLHISATATSAGDFVAYGDDEGGAGVLDVDKLWQELRTKDSGKVIDITHIPSIPTSKITGLDNALSGYVSSVTTSGAGNAVTGYAKSGNTLTLKKDLTFLTSVPKATSSAYGGIKIGYPESGKNYPVELDSSGRAYVSVPWVNTTYSLSSFGITATAEEINKLDGVTSNIQSQLNGKQAAGSYVTTNTAQDVTGLKTFARDAASVLYVENTAATSTSKYSAIVFQRAGSNIGIIAAGVDTNYLYRANPAFSTVYTILDTGNYTSALDSRYMRIGSSGYPTAYRKVFNLNGTAWSFLGTTTDAPTAYAPTTAGTSGYVLQSTGGTPAWAAQNSLVVKGIYERSLGVAAGDTMADLKSALTTQMGSGLNKPGSMGFVTATSVANIMSNWANDDYELVAGARTNFLRLDGYGSSIYGVFLVSGYQGSFYRLLKNSSTAWAGPYLILDAGNYTSYTVTKTGGGASGTWPISISGNATSATKLQTSRTLWGQSFNGTGNVSGNMTGVGSITGATFSISDSVGQMLLYNNTSKNDKRLTLYPQSNYAAIYNITADGSAISDLVLGNNSNALYYDASAARWGIGTSSPAYKLDVAGTLRATGQGTFDTIKITDNTSAAHITFGRSDAFNYISMPGDSSTLAIAPGGDISGAGSALCISNSATYPGYHNGTISLGTSSYRWSNVYSVLGSFSGLLTADSIAVTDKLYFPSPDGNQRYYIKFE